MNYTIKCKKYRWASTTPQIDVNFFSSVSPGSVSTVYLNDYLIDISNITYTFDNTKFSNYTNMIYRETSDFTMKLSGDKNNKYLQSYFELFTDTSFVKFFIEIYNETDALVYRGIVNQDNISENWDDSYESQVIDVLVVGLEKEFKEFYSNKKLINPDTVNWDANINIPVGSAPPIPTLPIKRFDNLIQHDLFTSPYIDFIFDDDVAGRYVSKYPQFYYSQNEGLNNTYQVGLIQFGDLNFFPSFRGTKNQILYTAAELTAAGFTSGLIQEIQLFMLNEEPETGLNTISNLYISMKNTSTENLTDFETTGLSQTYYAATRNFDFVGQHWERFVMQNPIEWDGTSNLLIQFCYYNKNTPYANVYVQNGITGKWINKQLDTGNFGGCAITSGGTDIGKRPAIKLAIGQYSTEIGIFIKNAYDRLYEDGISCYDYLDNLCLSMGWYFSFIGDKFVIRNIDSVDLPVENLDYTKFIEYEITKKLFRSQYNDIYINDGDIECGVEVNPYDNTADYLSGQRIHLYNIKEDDVIDTLWFKYPTGATGRRYALVSPPGKYFYKELEQDAYEADRYIKYQKLYAPDESSYTTEDFMINKNDILIINTTENSNRYGVDTISGMNGVSIGSDPDYLMTYNGNYGNTIIRIDESDYLTENYLSYIKRNEFRNNFAKYFKNSQNIEMTLKYNDVIYDFYKIFRISGNVEINGIWYLTGIKLNLIDETTELTMIKTLNRNTR